MRRRAAVVRMARLATADIAIMVEASFFSKLKTPRRAHAILRRGRS
jgi:hypothetical protein